MLVVMRALLRNQTATIIACVLVSALGQTPSNLSVFTAIVGIIISTLFFIALMRFGLLAMVFCWFTDFCLLNPITFDASAWYSGYGFAALAIFAAVVLYGFRFSLGSRPLLAASHLDD